MELFPRNRDRSPRLQVCHTASNFLVPSRLDSVTPVSRLSGSVFAKAARSSGGRASACLKRWETSSLIFIV
jgi:hypothetical protein